MLDVDAILFDVIKIMLDLVLSLQDTLQEFFRELLAVSPGKMAPALDSPMYFLEGKTIGCIQRRLLELLWSYFSKKFQSRQ
jgi:hypothetical protein